eukprot:m.242188 g.242188  ORF g.242188 m.242188 type:complete len:2074 (+) comp33791_c3_seq1:270-6491(+)
MSAWLSTVAVILGCLTTGTHAAGGVIHLNETSQVEVAVASETLTEFSLEFRTCRKSALIAYIVGTDAGTFLKVKAVAGFMKIEWNFDNTNGELVNYVAISDDCAWQKFAIVITTSKITFTVDDIPVSESVTLTPFVPKDGETILVGTVDRLSSDGTQLVAVSELESEEPFSGCVRALTTNTQAVDIVTAATVNRNTLDYCDDELVLAAKITYVVDEASALGFNGVENTFAVWSRYDLGLPGTSSSDEISFNLRTRERDGVVFFMGRRDSFYLIKLEGRGKLRFQFQLDANTPGEIQTSASINDGNWHSVTVTRNNLDVTLVLDEKSSITVRVAGATYAMTLFEALYIGGLDGTDKSQSFPTALAQENLDELVGCVQGFTFNNAQMTFDNVDTSSSLTLGCNGQPGVCDAHDCALRDPKVVCVDIWNSFQCECRLGWTGDNCDVDIDDCAAAGDDVCNRVGTCIDGNATYTCDCDDGWMGDLCEEVDRCTPSPCENGECSQDGFEYACECSDKFWGTNCSVACDTGNCDLSESYRCNQRTGNGRDCDACNSGYYNTGCQTPCATITSCVGDVTCRQSNGNQPSCDECTAGYYGVACASTCDVGDCFDFTSITQCNKNDGNSVKCNKCADGYFGLGAGDDCTRTCSAPNCDAPPTCSQDDGTIESCSGCNINFYGQTCDQSCDKGNCDGDVTCDQGGGGNRKCQNCKPGFYGEDCELTCSAGNCKSVASCDKATGQNLKCDECVDGTWGSSNGGDHCSSVCSNKFCTTVTECSKPQGISQTCAGCVNDAYQGITCQAQCDVGNCDEGNITCDQSGEGRVCSVCVSGFFESDCSSVCEAPPGCLDGTTIDCDQASGTVETCGECEKGSYGSTCDQQCRVGNCIAPVSCEQADGSNRVCDECDAGYHGVTCNETCVQGNCVDTVTCTLSTGEGRSCGVCDPGWSGPESGCVTEIDECASVPCLGNGECIDGLASYTCKCDVGWTNTTCNVEVHDGATFSSELPAYLFFDPNNKTVALPTQLKWSTLEFVFRTTLDRGVLVYALDYGLFFSVELIGDHIQVRYGEHATATLYPSAGVVLYDNDWHIIEISLESHTAKINQQSFTNIFGLMNGDDEGSGGSGFGGVTTAPPVLSSSFTANVGLYVGGVEYWFNKEFWRLKSRRSFGGCIRKITFDGDRELNLNEASKEVGVYHARENNCVRAPGGPCAGDPCDTECIDLWNVYECGCDVDGCVDPETISFDGGSMVQLTYDADNANGASNGIDFLTGCLVAFDFRTRSSTASLLHVQGKSVGFNEEQMLSVVVESETVVVTLRFGAGVSDQQQVTTPLDNHPEGSSNRGLWHRFTLQVVRVGDEVQVFGSVGVVDEVLTTFEFTNVSGLADFDVSDGKLMYGGVYADDDVSLAVKGCVQGLQINKRPVVFEQAEGLAVYGGGVDVGGQCVSDAVCSLQDDPCPLASVCEDYWNLAYCNCDAGYGPPGECTIDIDDCASAPCLNNGVCTDLVDAYSCNCNGTGYQGTNCSITVNDCAGSPCSRGECVDGHLTYECKCPLPYTGKICTEDVDECSTDPCVQTEFCSQTSPPACKDASDALACENWIGFTCARFTECDVGETFEVLIPTRTTDRVCNATQQCSNVTATLAYESVAATYTTDRTCTAVSPMCTVEDVQFESVDPTPTSDRVCANCSVCDYELDTFVSQNCTAETNTVCSGCTVCNASQWMVSDCATHTDRVCATPDICDVVDEYIDVEYTPTTNRICERATVCGALQFISTALTLTADRSCTNLTTCNVANEWERTAPDSITDRDCATCTRCFVGQYISQLCTPFADAQCSECVCANNGTCTAGAIGGFTCSCASGFYGSSCENTDPCDAYTIKTLDVPCKHDGVCVNNRVYGNFTCDCDLFHAGDRCQHTLCVGNSDPCSTYVHADGCVAGVGPGDHTCICMPGYMGATCNTIETECVVNPCQNGVCDGNGDGTYSCACDAGYSGQNCSEATASPTSSPTVLVIDTVISEANSEDADVAMFAGIGAAAGVLLIVIIIVVCCCCRSDGGVFEVKNNAYEEGSAVSEEIPMHQFSSSVSTSSTA